MAQEKVCVEMGSSQHKLEIFLDQKINMRGRYVYIQKSRAERVKEKRDLFLNKNIS